MSSSLLVAFDTYQKARFAFVQVIADASTRSQNLDTLQACGALSLLRPLLLDNVASIQQTAVLAIGRLANHSEQLATAVVDCGLVPTLICSFAKQNVCKRDKVTL
jgi:hypothetical protein